MITVKPMLDLPAPVRDATYAMYAETFADINEMAAQRHLMTAAEFREVAADHRVRKLLARNTADELLGVATVTNVLEAMPLVSPPFYRRHYPNHYARQAVWYVGFVGVRPRAPHVFRAIVSDLYACTMSNQGVAVMDFCEYNETVVDIPGKTFKLLRQWNPNTRLHRVDRQSTWVFSFDTVDDQ